MTCHGTGEEKLPHYICVLSRTTFFLYVSSYHNIGKRGTQEVLIDSAVLLYGWSVMFS